jgi:hypothetical protein
MSPRFEFEKTTQMHKSNRIAEEAKNKKNISTSQETAAKPYTVHGKERA